MLKKHFRKGALALALAGFTGAALAAVTFDPDTGKGFVGKGDVQNAFGWNDKALSTNVGGVSFSYSTTQTHQWDCVTGDRGVVTVQSTETTVHDVSSPSPTRLGRVA
jgi:hypothetical protein